MTTFTDTKIPFPDAASAPPLAFTGLAEQARLLTEREVSSRELVELSLGRIEASQPRLNAFRVVCAEAALAEADRADARLRGGDGGAHSPLLGVPVAIKDDVDLAGHTTPFGCGGAVAECRADAELVRRLRAAGAIIVGKTQSPELGQWHFTESPTFGATRNPWHEDHAPGGSSGGAAAAVAAGLVAGAIGSDGAGSIRIPAAWCGLVGLKPQRGRISTWPDPEDFHGLTVFGPLTRSAEDAALLLDAVAGNVAADLHQPAPASEPFAAAAAREPSRLRIALSLKVPFGIRDRLCEEHRAAIFATAERLEGLGHEVREEDVDYGLVAPALVPRGAVGVRDWVRDHELDRAALEPRTRVHARLGALLSGPALRAARAAEPSLRRRLGAIFERHDLVLTPVTATPPPRIGEFDGRGYWATGGPASESCPFAFPWNVTGWPGISVPAGLTAAGLPIGAQLLAREGQEGLLLSVAAQLE
ncbi:MAG TPA: amidase [Solirubrobacterales bacterium]|nr:amidase [Solirubrobacterales bacterium]